MKRSILLLASLCLWASATSAQDIYLDIGIGVGKAETKLNGVDVSSLFGSGVKETGVDLGLKFGFGPVADIPLHVVATISGTGHRFEDSFNYLQFNSYLFGPGLVYYPVPLLQLAGSVGLSFVSNQTDLPIVLYKSKSGWAGSFSLALDLGDEKNGVLIGVGFTAASNSLEVTGAEQKDSVSTIFVRYCYRNKTNRE